jgi:hypothetical protein
MRDHIKDSANLTTNFDDVRDVTRFKLAMQNNNSKRVLEQDFEKIKQAMANLLILTFPDYDLPFHLTCDASDVAMGAVLFQKKDGKELIIAVASQKFKKYEKRYTVHKKELRALVFGLSKFRHHIWCSPHQTTVYTDHQALQNVYNAKELPRTYNNWLNIISDFDLKVSHIPGKDNVLADALSRLTCLAVEMTQTSKDKHTVMREDSRASNEGVNDGESASAEGIQQNFNVHADLTVAQKRELIKHYHSFGHFGIEATTARLRMAGYQWPKIRQDVQDTIKGCETCLKYNRSRPLYHELKTSSVQRPWQIVQADLISSVKPHREYVAILVCKCCFSGYTVLRALKSKNAAEVAQKLFEIFSLYGPPDEFQADGGKEFTNELISEVWDKIGVKRRLHTPYNPRAQGVVENAIGSISTAIWKELKGQTDWPAILTKIEFCFNTKYSPMTKETPFSLMFGRSFWEDGEPEDTSQGGGRSWSENWEEIRKILYPAVAERISNFRKRQNQYFNDRHQLRREDLKKGTAVMIKDMNRTTKEAQRFVGPYYIVQRMNDGCYAIEDSDGLYASTVPLNHMVIADEYRREPTDDGENKDQNDRYEVEQILNHEGSGDTIKYLVKWKYYPNSQNTWESVDHIDDDDLIKTYWRKLDDQEKTQDQQQTHGSDSSNTNKKKRSRRGF